MSTRARDGLMLLTGMVVVGLLVHVVLSAELEPAALTGQIQARYDEAHAARSHGLPKAPLPPSVQPVPTTERLADLPCFGCHNLERYLTETRFGHPQHAVAGHCHVCHAFSQHFEVVVRKENCGQCHAE